MIPSEQCFTELHSVSAFPLLIAACVSDKAGEPMFEESGDEQSVLGSGPESPAADTPATTRRWQPTSRVHRYRSAPALLDRMLMNPRRRFLDDRIIAADLWGAELAILSAGMGFDGVIGLPNTDIETVRAAGGSYYLPACADNPIFSGATAAGINAFYRGTPDDPLTSTTVSLWCSPGPCWVQRYIRRTSCSP
ncbi:MAG: hypothetical protein Ct9H90mP5_07430 [Acidimicrobiaceae bacterium]|nr:MAG: hypothetical protein Ct9H90mP5_07430 [Acidimicrobiaceae bacterium]